MLYRDYFENGPRAALESAALSYLAAHYIDGVASTFTSQPPNHFTVQIVSNKYNPANFWFVIFLNEVVFRSSAHQRGTGQADGVLNTRSIFRTQRRSRAKFW